MLKQFLKTSAIVTLAGLTACATIVEGSTDSVNVITSPSINANCSLTNERGTFSTLTPAAASVKKSKSDLNITCSQPGSGATGQAKLESDIEPWAFGNILIGGLIGISIDWISGSAYNYPNEVTVPMTIPAPLVTAPTYITPEAAPIVVPAPAPFTRGPSTY